MHWWIVALVVNAGFLGAAAVLWSRAPRRTRPSVDGSAVEEARRRQQQALVIHDSVVQSIATAKLSLELGDTERGMAALEESLEAARSIITDLLGTPGSVIDLGPGDLRRTPSRTLPGAGTP
jgi:hypothetical protein